jgi:quinol monooxygenase YgiN
MIHVVATLELHAGKRKEFLSVFHAFAAEVCKENGCIEYGIAADVASGIPVQPPLRENAVVILEKWADLQALKTHLAAPGMKAYREQTKDLVAGRDLRILQSV